MLTQNVLDELIVRLKTKYKNLIKALALNHCTDDNGEFINLTAFSIKKSQVNKGYESAIMSELIDYADDQNVRIRLWITNDQKGLFAFYNKEGFTLDSTMREGSMTYHPSKKRCKLA